MEPSMPSMILATNSLHTAPACSLSTWSRTNMTSSVERNSASPRIFSNQGKAIRKASIAIFHLSNPYPSKCYKTTEHLFRLSPPIAFFRPCRGCIRRECRNFVTQITIRDPFTLCLTFKNATKSTLKKQFPIKKFGRFNKKHYLCTHENPPSLFTMLKSAGRFIFIR